MRKFSAKSAFSLVELSIVLVILGLLVGGVLSGRSLIKAAELRSITSDIMRYQGAVLSFRDRYFALPGDMVNATNFWGAEPIANCPGNSTTPSTTTATCNGDGNGQIQAIAGFNERHRTWQHLANAGLIEGLYTGVGGSTGTANHVARSNVPGSRLSSKAGWIMSYGAPVSGNANSFDGEYGHVLQLINSVDGVTGDYNTLRPEDMWGLDVKMDDGLPAYGRILPYKSPLSPGCTTSDTSAFSQYDLATTGIVCAFRYAKLF